MVSLPASRTTCLACGAALSLLERHAGNHCNDWQCRLRRQQAQRKAAFRTAMVDARDAAAQAAGDTAASQAPVIMVRRHADAMGPVPDAWREGLLRHLWALQPEAEALRNASDLDDAQGSAQADAAIAAAADAPPVAALLGGICARCGGYCCRHGNGSYGFIDAELMVRHWRERPLASYDDLVTYYVDAVPERHLLLSCGFHGAQGCTLMRESRSDICNGFECRGLVEARDLANDRGARRVYLVRHDDGKEAVGDFVPPLQASQASS